MYALGTKRGSHDRRTFNIHNSQRAIPDAGMTARAAELSLSAGVSRLSAGQALLRGASPPESLQGASEWRT